MNMEELMCIYHSAGAPGIPLPAEGTSTAFLSSVSVRRHSSSWDSLSTSSSDLSTRKVSHFYPIFTKDVPWIYSTSWNTSDYLACQQVSGDVGPDIPVAQLEPWATGPSVSPDQTPTSRNMQKSLWYVNHIKRYLQCWTVNLFCSLNELHKHSECSQSSQT